MTTTRRALLGLRARSWYATRPFVWRWRLGYWDWDAIRVCAYFVAHGRHKQHILERIRCSKCGGYLWDPSCGMEDSDADILRAIHHG